MVCKPEGRHDTVPGSLAKLLLRVQGTKYAKINVKQSQLVHISIGDFPVELSTLMQAAEACYGAAG